MEPKDPIIQDEVDHIHPLNSVVDVDLVPDSTDIDDIYRYLAPYHIHYVEGIEGHSLNPDGAEHNFDSMLMLTTLIRERTTVPKKSTTLPDGVSWFEDKYPASDVTAATLRKPTNVVRTWLKKLGPHNDLTGAADDLTHAYDWIIESSPNELHSSELSLIADIDLELAELSEGEERLIYLEDAEEYLRTLVADQLYSLDFGKAAFTQAKLSSVIIDKNRQLLLGTRLLMENPNNVAYDMFKQIVKKELVTLDEQITIGLAETRDQINSFESDELAIQDLKSRKNLGVLFEAFTYSAMLSSIYLDDKLSSASIKMGTIRQESGTTHKNTTKNTGSDQPHIDGFNFNFDLLYNELNSLEDGNGLYSTIYLQNKITPSSLLVEQSSQVSANFFGGKNFKVLTPNAMRIELDERAKYKESAVELFDAIRRELINLRVERRLSDVGGEA